MCYVMLYYKVVTNLMIYYAQGLEALLRGIVLLVEGLAARICVCIYISLYIYIYREREMRVCIYIYICNYIYI